VPKIQTVATNINVIAIDCSETEFMYKNRQQYGIHKYDQKDGSKF